MTNEQKWPACSGCGQPAHPNYPCEEAAALRGQMKETLDCSPKVSLQEVRRFLTGCRLMNGEGKACWESNRALEGAIRLLDDQEDGILAMRERHDGKPIHLQCRIEEEGRLLENAREAVRLLNSMVYCGEKHSDISRRAVDLALGNYPDGGKDEKSDD